MDRVFRVVASILVVGVILYYAAHKYKGNLTTPHPDGSSSSGSSGSSLLSSTDKTMADKLEPFIHCINTSDSKIAAAARAYHKMVAALKADPNDSGFGWNADFVIAGGFSQFERSTDNQSSCGSKLEQASAMPPKLADLDAIGPDYAATLRKVAPLISQASFYYDQKDYKDDHMARGSQLDSQISPLLDHLRQLSNGMRAGVERENNIIKRHELDATEARYGQNLRWHILNFMIQSRTTFDKMEELADNGKLDAASLEQAMQPVQAAFEAARTYAAAHPQENTHENLSTTWSSIEGSASRYLAGLKELRRELQSNAPPQALNSQLKYVESDFNSVVESYNGPVDIFE